MLLHKKKYLLRWMQGEHLFMPIDEQIVYNQLDDNAVIMEFKVHEPEDEKTLEDTVKAALNQIEVEP